MAHLTEEAANQFPKRSLTFDWRKLPIMCEQGPGNEGTSMVLPEGIELSTSPLPRELREGTR